MNKEQAEKESAHFQYLIGTSIVPNCIIKTIFAEDIGNSKYQVRFTANYDIPSEGNSLRGSLENYCSDHNIKFPNF